MEAGLLICVDGGLGLGWSRYLGMSKPVCHEYWPCVEGDAGVGKILLWISSARASKNAQQPRECAMSVVAFWAVEAGKATDGENV